MFKIYEAYGKLFIDVIENDSFYDVLYSGDLKENVANEINKIKNKIKNKRVYIKNSMPHRMAYILGTILPNICEEVWFYSSEDLEYYRVS
jgi:hypothetical protein